MGTYCPSRLLVLHLFFLLNSPSLGLDQLSLRRSLPAELQSGHGWKEALSGANHVAGRQKEEDSFRLNTHAHFPLSLGAGSSQGQPVAGSRGQLQDVRNLLPQYLGSIVPWASPRARPGAGFINWTGPCMLENWASATWTSSARRTSSPEHRHITLTVKSRRSRRSLCSDVVAVATPFRVRVALLNAARQTVSLRIRRLAEEEAAYVAERGVALFLLPEGLSGAAEALGELPWLLSNTEKGEEQQLDFLRSRMNASFRPRSKPWLAQLAQGRALRRQLAFIPPGSLLLTSKFRGPWGLFESLEKWVSGAWSGHMALVLTGPCVQSEEAQGPGREGRKPQGTGGLGLTAMDQPTGDEGAETEREPGQGREGKGVETGAEGGGRVDQGTVDREAEHIRQGDGGSRPRTEADEGCLWVAESGRIGPGGQPLIQVVRFEEWWVRIVLDPYEPQAVVLPLSAEWAQRWNNSRAWDLVRQVEGLRFGFHNFLFSWIDTPRSNFPAPLDAHTVAVVLSVWRHLVPGFVASVMEEALNKRLGTQGLSFVEVLTECVRRNMTFAELLAIPEDDTWVYSDGISASCVGLAMRVWKAAGLFGALTPHINAGEFTIRDAYQLEAFEKDPSALPDWCNRGRPVAFCQLTGKLEVDLPGYNSIQPYAHMNERCPSMPPSYERTEGC